MVIDSSALLSILFGEIEQRDFTIAIGAAAVRRISAVTLAEAMIVAEARVGPAGSENLDRLIARFQLTVSPVDAEQARAAHAAWRRFGKGRHPARLNLGDCFSYALAVLHDEELLFKGDDFARTDVRRAPTAAP